jgi:hypothetical protein
MSVMNPHDPVALDIPSQAPSGGAAMQHRRSASTRPIATETPQEVRADGRASIAEPDGEAARAPAVLPILRRRF